MKRPVVARELERGKDECVAQGIFRAVKQLSFHEAAQKLD